MFKYVRAPLKQKNFANKTFHLSSRDEENSSCKQVDDLLWVSGSKGRSGGGTHLHSGYFPVNSLKRLKNYHVGMVQTHQF